MEANHLASTAEARGALLESLQHQRNRLVAELRGDPAGAMSVSFSRDGRRLSEAGFSGNIQQWDVATRREQRALDTVLVATVGAPAAAFSIGGNLMAYSTGNGPPVVWDLARRRRVGDFSTGNPADYVTALAFSAGGTILAVSYDSNAIRLGVWHTMKRLADRSWASRATSTA